MVDVVHDFFRGSTLPREFSASVLVLIAKVEDTKGFDKLRPISLCSVFYKLCTEILVGRIAPLLPKFIAQK